MNKSLVVAKMNFRNIKSAYIVTAIVFGAIVAQDIVFVVLRLFGVDIGSDSNSIAVGNVLYLLVVLSAVSIPASHFRKMMNLGGKRADFFTGGAVTHAIMAAAVSLAGMILYYTYEHFNISFHGGYTLNVLYWFGWIGGGPVVAFFQQFAFLLLLAAFVHTLSAAQDKWYGWVADVLIVAIISVFTPIAPLRAALAWFFRIIIFESAPLQISACLVLALVIYMLNKPIFARKTI